MSQDDVLYTMIKNEFDAWASREGKKKAYMTLSKRHHPDKNGGDMMKFQCLEKIYAPIKLDEQNKKQDAAQARDRGLRRNSTACAQNAWQRSSGLMSFGGKWRRTRRGNANGWKGYNEVTRRINRNGLQRNNEAHLRRRSRTSRIWNTEQTVQRLPRLAPAHMAWEEEEVDAHEEVAQVAQEQEVAPEEVAQIAQVASEEVAQVAQVASEEVAQVAQVASEEVAQVTQVAPEQEGVAQEQEEVAQVAPEDVAQVAPEDVAQVAPERSRRSRRRTSRRLRRRRSRRRSHPSMQWRSMLSQMLRVPM